MPLNESERNVWAKYMINYFIDNGFAMGTYSEIQRIKFKVKNVFGLDVSIGNKYNGIITILFGNSNQKNKFIEIAQIERIETIISEEEISNINVPNELKKLLGNYIRIEYSSVNFPCRIYIKEEYQEISFYDNIKFIESTEIIEHRKIIFNQLLFCLEQMKSN